MMPHEHKILVLKYLKWLFKDKLLCQKDIFKLQRDDAFPALIKADKWNLDSFRERHILLIHQYKLFSYIYSPFFEVDEFGLNFGEEYFSPFYPQDLDKTDYDTRLQAVFQGLNHRKRKHFSEVMKNLKYKDFKYDEVYLSQQRKYKNFDRLKIFHNKWHNKPKIKPLLKSAHENILNRSKKKSKFLCHQFILSPIFETKYDICAMLFCWRSLRVDQHVRCLTYHGDI